MNMDRKVSLGFGRLCLQALLAAGLLSLPTAVSAETVEVGKQLEAVSTETVEVGKQFEAFSLEDQFGKPLAVDESVRAILFVRDRVADEVMKRALADEGPTQLAGAGAVYLSNMDGMPPLIRKYIAIPMLRQRAYAVGVDQDSSHTGDFPSREGQPTLLVLEDLRITRIEQLESIEVVRATLAQLTPPGKGAPAVKAPNGN